MLSQFGQIELEFEFCIVWKGLHKIFSSHGDTQGIRFTISLKSNPIYDRINSFPFVSQLNGLSFDYKRK